MVNKCLVFMQTFKNGIIQLHVYAHIRSLPTLVQIQYHGTITFSNVIKDFDDQVNWQYFKPGPGS